MTFIDFIDLQSSRQDFLCSSVLYTGIQVCVSRQNFPAVLLPLLTSLLQEPTRAQTGCWTAWSFPLTEYMKRRIHERAGELSVTMRWRA